MVDIMPLHDLSSVRPLTGLVINLNVSTPAHRDEGDDSSIGCFVISIGPYTGGELCFWEPRLAIEMRSGDVVAFNSKRIVHFNLHYQGIRCSIVIHSDKSSASYLKDGNGWAQNDWVQ